MSLSEFELKKIEKALASFMASHRPPVHLRKEIDLGYEINNQSIELFEVRPRWDDPSQSTRTPVAKTTYVKTGKCWNIFWQRADLKWHRYKPAPKVKSVEEFLAIVADDKHCCFFG